MNRPLEQAGPLASFAGRVRDFWFAPGDPTTLGFVRVCAGLVLLYVLLASGPLLSSHYAPDGWVDGEAADAIRRDYPWLPPETNWEYETPPWFLDMDANGDGFVTDKEWAAHPNEFAMIDGSVDGKKDRRVSLEEAMRHGRFLMIRPELWEQSEEAKKGWWRVWRRWEVDPARTIDVGQPFFSHFFHLESQGGRVAAHVLALLAVGLFTLGVGTRVTSVLTWVAALSYSHRVSVALFGMDTMMGIVLLYLMIGPCGSALSVDRWVTNWLRRREGLPDEPPPHSPLATTAIRLMQVHFCVMYLFAGMSKLQGAAWWNGTAIWMTLTSYEFVPKSEAYTALMKWLTLDRWVWETFHTTAAWGTLALEISFPFLIWNRKWRWVLMCGSVMMHTGIAVAMGLTAFSLFMVCILFSFVPPEAVRSLLSWAGGLAARLPRPARQEAREPATV